MLDPKFRVELISQTPYPQTTIWYAMHQDYSEEFVYDETPPTEEKAGEIIVRRLLKVGHFGPLEHPQIVLNVGYFPHCVMQQARTHRLASFDVQSMRYTGKRICRAADGETPMEDVLYLRPVGDYNDRFGKKYHYSEEARQYDLDWCLEAAKRYHRMLEIGMAEEHARGILPFDFRQHFVVSMNMRSLMHFLTIRGKKDAQLEIQELTKLILPHFERWAPQVYQWFIENQWQKGRLAP